jgi:glyoxylase-like metal-dependent hydrolase (beta-lactamase superfamily II)
MLTSPVVHEARRRAPDDSPWHVDHTDGNAWLHAEGAAITAHENTKKHLSTSTRVDDWSYTFPPAPAEALPTTIFSDANRLRHNDTALALKYYGPAHTDSDISVVFEEADVIHVGGTASTPSSTTRPEAASIA